VVSHQRQQRVAAARDQTEERRLEGVRREEARGDVPVQMVDARQRELVRGGECLRRGEPDEQRRDQTRATGHGDQVDLLERGAGARERIVDHVPDQLEVVARGDLGYDTAVAVVNPLR
jgi:hypothetical protein